MPKCNRCDDQSEYVWFEKSDNLWRLGLKLDINTFNEHICKTKTNYTTKRDDYYCLSCGRNTGKKGVCDCNKYTSYARIEEFVRLEKRWERNNDHIHDWCRDEERSCRVYCLKCREEPESCGFFHIRADDFKIVHVFKFEVLQKA